MRKRIGVPRALMFYKYYPFIKGFLEGCGCQVVASPPTDLDILEEGTRSCVDDICVAVKVYFGHVRFLVDKVDAILVPRLVSVERRRHDTFTCPKLIAAPDMLRFLPGGLPPVLEWVVDLRRAPWWWGCLRVARRLGATPCQAWEAYRRARRDQERYERLLGAGMLPEDALAVMENGGNPSQGGEGPGGEGPREGFPLAGGERVTVGVVGHPYLVGDRLLNKDLFHWLSRGGARCLPGTAVPAWQMERELGSLPELSWSYERELLATASAFLGRGDVDGVIYLTSFGCGPDSMVMEMFKREVLKGRDKPFMEIVLDEHSAEAGVRTRAEAFVDMLRYRSGRRGGGRRV